MTQRILVYGVTGSGKTALAAEISMRTGLPWYAVDDLTWEKDWVSVPDDEQQHRIEAICAREQWILDTAYTSWLDIPMCRADLIVALDYPRVVSLFRLLRRTIKRIATHEPACNGNVESLRRTFSSDSIIAWHFRSFQRKRARMRSWEADPAKPELIRFTSPHLTRSWVQGLRPDFVEPSGTCDASHRAGGQGPR